jgi:hypothetical protein
MSGPSAYSNAQGTYVAFYALPPCFVSLTPTTTLTAELRFSAFDPNAATAACTTPTAKCTTTAAS